MFFYKSFTSVPRFQYLQRYSAGRLGLSLILALLMVSLLLLVTPDQAAAPPVQPESTNIVLLMASEVWEKLSLITETESYDVATQDAAQ